MDYRNEFIRLFTQLALTEPPSGSALDTILDDYQEAYNAATREADNA